GWVEEHLPTAGGKTTRNGVPGYEVRLADALAIIRRKKPDVAEWFDGWAFNQPYRLIFFPENCCKVVVEQPSPEHQPDAPEAQESKLPRRLGARHQEKPGI